MKILGIGNAIVDVICKVEDKFITQNAHLFSEEEIETLKSHIKKLKTAIENGTKDEINLTMKDLNDFSAPMAQIAMDFNIKQALSGKKV